MSEKEKRKKKKKSKENPFTTYEDGLLPTKYLNRKRSKIGEKGSKEGKSVPRLAVKAKKKNRLKKQKTEKSNDRPVAATHDNIPELTGIKKFNLQTWEDPFCI